MANGKLQLTDTHTGREFTTMVDGIKEDVAPKTPKKLYETTIIVNPDALETVDPVISEQSTVYVGSRGGLVKRFD
ncbi:hypothetical protein GOV06_00600 [Candidatus Woesearchaeota archaeon]|nr:hypothetical protein [Candidatus Woesearchaeota archaeon]